MGSRGAGSGRNAGKSAPNGRAGGKMGDFLTPNENNTPELDADLIRRANEASTVFDQGDATVRQYNSNVDEIRGMDLTDEEKAKAINDIHELTTQQLEAEGNSRSQYSMGEGVARPNANRIRQNADKAATARQRTRDYMDDLRTQQKAKAKAAADQRRNNALSDALKNGELSVTVDGVTYTRTSKRSKTFTRR